MICLGQYLSVKDLSRFIDGYEKLLRNNKTNNTLWESVENKLNHHVISADFGIDDSNTNRSCEHLLGEKNEQY